MKKAIPIILIGVLVLSGLGAVALPETKENTLIEKTEVISLSPPILIENNKYISVELSEAHFFINERWRTSTTQDYKILHTPSWIKR